MYEEYRELGYNYRMTDVQAAIGIAQLSKLDRLLARRKAIAARYDAAFAPLPALRVPARPAYADHAYQSYAIRLLPACRVNRDDMLRELVEQGVSCRRGIPPMHLEPLYRERYGTLSLPVTEEVAARSVFLPIFGSLSDADQDRIIHAVVGIVSR